jgi:hypothetical protein
VCPRGEILRYWNTWKAQRARRYKAKAKTCDACALKPRCTTNKEGRTIFRHFDEGYLDGARSYRETEPYRKALRKRKVWVEPLFAEAKDRPRHAEAQAQGVGEGQRRGALMVAAGSPRGRT